MPGHANTDAPPLLDRHQADLLDAVPPVVTGVDVDNAFERWEHLSRKWKASTQGGSGVGKHGGNPVISQGGGNAAKEFIDSCEILTRGDHVSIPHATTVHVDSRAPLATISLDGALLDSNVRPCSSEEENGGATRRIASEELASGVGWESTVDGGARSPAIDAVASTTAAGAASDGLLKSEGGVVEPDYLEAYAPPLGIGLTRLCRRAVILLTRSPACPDLMAGQTNPAEQRIYHQMEPLLARANMTYEDLHPPVSTIGIFSEACSRSAPSTWATTVEVDVSEFSGFSQVFKFSPLIAPRFSSP